MSFTLPPGVSSSRSDFAEGVVYTFRHETLGELGRLVVQEVAGETRLTGEVAGDPDDPMTGERQAILEPIVKALGEILTSIKGGGSSDPEPAVGVPVDQELIESKMIPCERCKQPAALLIFANRGSDLGSVEDAARVMYPVYGDLDVNTWVIGQPMAGHGFASISRVLIVWPKRQPVKEMTASEFNVTLDALLELHCGSG